jgi:hypothetical protein
MTFLDCYPEVSPGARIGSLQLLKTPEILVEVLAKFTIRALYLVSSEEFEQTRTTMVNFSSVPIYKFSGGYMENSLVLFPTDTKEDIDYIQFITGFTPS